MSFEVVPVSDAEDRYFVVSSSLYSIDTREFAMPIYVVLRLFSLGYEAAAFSSGVFALLRLFLSSFEKGTSIPVFQV